MKKKIITAVLTAIMLFSAVLNLNSCTDPQPADTSATTAASGESETEKETGPSVTDKETENATERVTVNETDPATGPETETEKITEPETTKEPEEDPKDDVYKTSNGVKYTVSDKTGDGDTFKIKDGFVITFEAGQFNGDFNRISLGYSSDKPLKIFVTYKISGKDVTDDFYIEAGQNAVFNGLISSYLENKKGSALASVKIDSCKGENAAFKLNSVSVSAVTVYNSKTTYIENDRFKVGIQLGWGGGINYIQDKTCKIGGLTNLINSHDTGRLIQQSYYGTSGNSEYTPGHYNNSKWRYNPVQGGDQYGNSSRLIDVIVGDKTIYIKSQPQDWSLNGKITKSYMENTYTLYEDRIEVGNRFVDFSGWDHPYTHQELPAFYTVSYLDRFTWYNGSKPWTDAALSYRDDLQFWGDPKYAADCQFFVKEENTETWCSWTSKTSGFGIGLFVPNVDLLYAGKFSYNGSKLASNGATNYVAPLNNIKMVSFEPIEYSYLITTGTVDEIRATFKAHKDFADNASLHKNYTSMRVTDVNYASLDFTKSAAVNALNSPLNTEISYNSQEKALALTVSEPNDPQVMIDYMRSVETLYAKDYKKLKITYMIPSKSSRKTYECDLFLCTGDKTAPDGSERTRITLTCDGEYHTATVDLSKLSFWSGKINKIRFDYFDACAKGDTIYVKSFELQ